MTRHPYERRMRRGWWLGHRRYVFYMLRESTCLFIGLYCLLLTIGLISLARGPGAWRGFVAAASSAPGVLFQVVCLAFALFHTVTWFAVTPKAMPLRLNGRLVPGSAIVAAHYAVWLVASLGILYAARV
jgi:fumarate reductase subunit C